MPTIRYSVALLSISILCCVPRVVSADVVISEIMYDVPKNVGADNGNEWIEVFNAGPTAIDISKYKLFDGANHTIKVTAETGSHGNPILLPGDYAIVADNAAQFSVQYPSEMRVFDSSYNLKNTGATLALVSSAKIRENEITYSKSDGAAGDGKSLAKLRVEDMQLLPIDPTPGRGSLISKPYDGKPISTVAAASSGHTAKTSKTKKPAKQKGMSLTARASGAPMRGDRTETLSETDSSDSAASGATASDTIPPIFVYGAALIGLVALAGIVLRAVPHSQKKKGSDDPLMHHGYTILEDKR